MTLLCYISELNSIYGILQILQEILRFFFVPTVTDVVHVATNRFPMCETFVQKVEYVNVLSSSSAFRMFDATFLGVLVGGFLDSLMGGCFKLFLH